MSNADKAYHALDKAAPFVFDDPDVRDAFEFLKLARAERPSEPSDSQVQAFIAAINSSGYVLDRVAARVGLRAAMKAERHDG